MLRRYLPVIALALVSACTSPSIMPVLTDKSSLFANANPSADITPTVAPAATTTSAATNTLSLPTESATSARPTVERSLPAAAASITPEAVQFHFDLRMAGSGRVFIHQGISAAIAALGEAGLVAVYADTNLDELDDEANQYYGRTKDSPESEAFRKGFLSTGVATSDKGAIFVWISPRWEQSSAEFKMHTMVHEYFHIVQEYLSRKSVNQTAPVWLFEGAADYVSYRVLQGIRSPTTMDQVHADRVTGSRGLSRPLQSATSITDPQDPLFPYYVGYLAVEYLTDKYGGGKLDA